MTDNDSHTRWQNILITQLGLANNLIILLAVGLLGFGITFLKDVTVLSFYQKIFFWCSCILILVSIGFGITVIINRLDDFKITAQIARKRQTGNRDGIENDRQESKGLGKQTWNYFIIQVSTFLVGFLCLLVLILIQYKDKIA
ncbi:hypothetical protein [Flavobacterium reichenbachii]|uniref:DUF3899 domain-containing protein n=1 Tax=Flavobacterium reichenbachii TaxID=362418 RepID=A0A085ZJ66_9FLAO|nr:hypothetical protein [Flavobacterium reichenbachii]KFF04480.1 hypothetical protein IW19_02570 [Flavobacterium reichenbachii]OXB14455.1 hypothetical protein B0A68_12485 [Flavobacterium reichenbachii]